jgi:cyclopropane fatty-acyl-phospholipid synthase-like methyltransferase
MPDPRRFAPSTERNRAPILDVLARVLPRPSGGARVLEIASGAGEHAIFFAEALPGVRWQPTDPDEGARASIEAWRRHAGLANVLPPQPLDVCRPWPREAYAALDRVDAIVCINMIHIAPWRATEGLMEGAAAVLADEGVLVTYGPYRRDGRHTAPSNEAFDASLRARDPAWGVRDLEAVEDEARRHGLRLREIVEMPANNLMLIFRKSTTTATE